MRLLTLFFILAGLPSLAGQALIDTTVEVNGNALHFTILPGEGVPIVFEAGNGDSGAVWLELFNAIRKETNCPLISYDRAGLGESSFDSTAVNFASEILSLESGLRLLGFEKELFMVAHSFGAGYALTFMEQYPASVKGAVLVDPLLSCFMTPKWTHGYLQTITSEQWEMLRNYRIGLYHVLRQFNAIAKELEGLEAFSAVPTTVIAAGNILPMVKETEQEQWIDCLRSFGTAEGNQYVLVPEAGHKVWEHHPQEVVAVIIAQYRAVITKK